MGYDIVVRQSKNDNSIVGIEQFYISYNHSKMLKEYGFYPRDFNGKNVCEVLIVMNTAISKFYENGFWPDWEIRSIPDLLIKTNKSSYDIERIEKISKRYYEENENVLMAILMEIRDKIEKWCKQYWVWTCD